MSKIFSWLAYGYITLPILIFFIGWCNPLVAILGSIIILASFYFACKNAPELWCPSSKKQCFFLISLGLIAIIWVCWSGIGALVFQNSDHNCRNPIFELLVTKPWPVVAEYRKGFFSTVENPIVMTYYLAFWLPSAVVGKVFNSVQIGYYAQVLWASLGVFLVFWYLLASIKRKNYLPIIIFMFFGGLDIVGVLLTRKYYLLQLEAHLEWWLAGYLYESFTTQLFWVFNQALPAWLITLVLLKEKNNKSILFLYSCLLLHSTLPSIGLFPIVTYLMIKNGNPPSKSWFSFTHIKDMLKSAFTFQNTIGMAVITVVSYFYLSENISGGNFAISNKNFLFEFVVFVLIYFSLKVGVYFVMLWKSNKTEPLYYIILILLLFIPFIRVGYTIDFCMRGSIPALVILCLFVIKMFDEFDKHKLACVVLSVTLLLGAFAPIHEFSRTVIKTHQGITKAKSKLSVPNFFAYINDNKFLMYFGKNVKQGGR